MIFNSRKINLFLMAVGISAVAVADQSAAQEAYRQVLESRHLQSNGRGDSGGNRGGGNRGGGGRNNDDRGGGGNGNGNGNGRGSSSNDRNDGRNNPLDGDYLIRFNKVSLIDRFDSDRDILPLKVGDFPVRGNTLDILKRKTIAVSVTGLDDYEVQLDVLDVIENGRYMNGYPTHATSDKDSIFWDKFLEVCEMQLARMQNPDAPASSIGLPLPGIWEGYNLDMVAQAVRDEVSNQLYSLPMNIIPKKIILSNIDHPTLYFGPLVLIS